ncbi:MAG: thiol:disulfide interchange protein DsbA/DsbL [Steroidobacteraceae bacterium]
MRLRQLVLCLGLGLALAACGRNQSAPERPAASTPAVASRAAAPNAAVTQQKAAEQESDLPSKITRMNEDGSETVEDVPGDSGAHNPLLAAVASTVAAATTAASAAAPSGWQEGVNYTRIVPAQPTAVPPGQVEVLEFFWYACPHCNAIDPMVEAWKRTKPPYISFSRVHVMWNDAHRAHARLYYTLESLGKLDQLHGEVFKEIHMNGDPLVAADPAETERMQAAFVKKFGISESAFRDKYHSFDVDNAMRKADELVQRYRVDGVPRFIVNGKYVVDVASAGSPERLISLIGDLAAQEHKR